MRQKIVSMIFLFVIFGFFLISFFIPDKDFSYNENRELAQKPELTAEALLKGTFMDDYESYVTDQIFLRDQFVNISTNIKLLLGQKEINGVYFSDNYFVEKFQDSDIDYEALDKIESYILTFMQNHPNAKLGLIPTSGGVVDGLYPKYSENVNQKELIQNIYDNAGNGQTIDIFSKLKEHQSEEIYYRTDHHWNTLGAYYGYEAIIEALGENVIDLSNYEFEIVDDEFSGTIQSKVNYDIGYDVIFKYVPKFDTDYIMTINEDPATETNSLYVESKLESKEKYAVFLGGNNATTRIKNNAIQNEKKLLVIKDSYSHCLTPFIINNYSEVLLLDPRYYMGGVQTFLTSEQFDDIVILYNIKNFVDDRNLIRLNK